ncbi:MAG: response regulator [Spirochaetes bacterium]|nr:response regulator [Spirochaetota bacterium]
MRVLLVEDNPLNIRLFYDTLSMKGYEVTVARNGNEALEVLKNITPDIIVLDLYMPGMSGFRFANTISKDLKYSSIPIIVVSASSSVYDVKEMASYNIKAYLVKPVAPTKLLETIKKVIIGKEYSDSLNKSNQQYVSSGKPEPQNTPSSDQEKIEAKDSSLSTSFKREVETGIRVSVDDLVEGMVLGAPVVKNKAVIYKEGSVVDSKMIEKIKNLGVNEIYITKDSFEKFKDIIKLKQDTEESSLDIFKDFEE